MVKKKSNVVWEIRYYQLDPRTGKIVGEGRYYKKYKRKGYAKRMANIIFGDKKLFRWWLMGINEKPVTFDNIYNDFAQVR